MARQRFTLPASYGGLLRYDEEVSYVKLNPGHVVIITLVVALTVILLHMLS